MPKENPNVFFTPLVVCCGLGVDSVAMLVGLKTRGIRPDIIIFADVGSERQSTYDYIRILNDWLQSVGFPTLTIVTYVAQDFKHWPPYFSLEENLLANTTLPSIAYGGKTCSHKWKITPINQYCAEWDVARDWWGKGFKILKAIGFEDSKHELSRTKRSCNTFATQKDERSRYKLWFPLQDWGWNRDRCKVEITLAGLPIPDKSSCYFCTAMKPWEVDTLPINKLKRVVIIETRASKRHLDYAEKRALQHGLVWNGKPLTEGLWRKRVKGKHASGKPNGAFAKPGSMTEYIREQGLLPSAEVDRLQAATPTQSFTKNDLAKLGFNNWQDWLTALTS